MEITISKQSMLELAEVVSNAVVTTLEQRGLVSANSNVESASANSTVQTAPKSKRTAYQKTEQLLYNYMGFKRIVDERMAEIENIKRFGVPKRSGSIVEYTAHTGTVGQLVLPEESVDAAIHAVERSVEDTVQAIALIDKCMAALKYDPYYKILEMRYFEGRTQEDIALEFNCTQQTISNNKNRLVRELSMQIFPNQVVQEMLA